MRENLERDGYCLLPAIAQGVLAQIDALTRSVASDDRRGGLREPQQKLSGLSELAKDAGMHAHANFCEPMLNLSGGFCSTRHRAPTGSCRGIAIRRSACAHALRWTALARGRSRTAGTMCSLRSMCCGTW